MNDIYRGRATRLACLAVALTASAWLAGTGLTASALAAVSSPHGWGAQAKVPGASSSLSPAETTDGSTRYVAYTTAAGHIDYVIHKTSWWPKVRTVSGKSVNPSTDSDPAITIFRGHLYVFWVDSSGHIRYSDLDGTTWKPTKTLGGTWGTATSSATPSVTVSGSGSTSTLWAAWKGLTNDDIYVSWTMGSSFAAQQTAVKDATSDSPAIAGYLPGDGGQAIMLAYTDSTGGIKWGAYDGVAEIPLGTVPQAGTNAAPSLALMTATPGQTLWLAWKGTNLGKVFYSSVPDFSGPGPAWEPQATLPSATTSTGPALAVSGTSLYAVYKSHSSDHIYTETDTAP